MRKRASSLVCPQSHQYACWAWLAGLAGFTSHPAKPKAWCSSGPRELAHGPSPSGFSLSTCFCRSLRSWCSAPPVQRSEGEGSPFSADWHGEPKQGGSTLLSVGPETRDWCDGSASWTRHAGSPRMNSCKGILVGSWDCGCGCGSPMAFFGLDVLHLLPQAT